jgi:phage-Barnase-EndoU-ColicinE5/D-RelE like nuclease3
VCILKKESYFCCLILKQQKMDYMHIDTLKEIIYTLYDECLESPVPFHRKLDLFIVPETLVEKILLATGINVDGHWVCIDNYGILHTLEQHGSLLSEAKRGQIAVEKEDFIRFLDVFLNPDEIELVGITKRTNLPLIQFKKTIEDKIFVVKEVRTISSLRKKKVSRVVFHTMYKIKATKKTS